MEAAAAVLSEDDSRRLLVALVRFLRWSQAPEPEDLASETFVRVLERVRAGLSIENLSAYAEQVARNVLMEDRRQRGKRALLVEGYLELEAPPGLQERVSFCLDRCKKECLSRREVHLIELYYGSDKPAKIANRKKLAKKLGISLNALRLQAFQIRRRLRVCVEQCLKETVDR